MIRYGLYQLASTAPSPLLVQTATKPLAVEAARFVRYLSTKPKRTEERLEEYSDKFDESDALEVGKEKHSPANPPPRRYQGPAFPLLKGFDDFFAPTSLFRDPFAPFFSRHESLLSDIMPVLRNFPSSNTNIRQTLLRSSPGYEIKESDGEYEIAMDLPSDLRASDLEIHVDGDVLHLTGKRVTENKGVTTTLQLDKRFSMGPHVDKERLTANLSNGVLVVKAPKMDQLEPPKQTVRITELPHSEADILNKTYSDAFDESDWAETGKQGHETPK